MYSSLPLLFGVKNFNPVICQSLVVSTIGVNMSGYISLINRFPSPCVRDLINLCNCFSVDIDSSTLNVSPTLVRILS